MVIVGCSLNEAYGIPRRKKDKKKRDSDNINPIGYDTHEFSPISELGKVQNKEDGYVASFGWEKLVGEIALTETDLHPSGWIVVNNERIFAVSEGNFIDKNVKVIILSVDGNRVVVRKK